MRNNMPRSLICAGLLALFTASAVTEADAAAIKTDLCSRRTGKRITVTVLKVSADFFDVLNEDGERVVLQASGYEQCAAAAGPAQPHSGNTPPTPPRLRQPPWSIHPSPRPSRTPSTRSESQGRTPWVRASCPILIAGYAGKVGAQVAELTVGRPCPPDLRVEEKPERCALPAHRC